MTCKSQEKHWMFLHQWKSKIVRKTSKQLVAGNEFIAVIFNVNKNFILLIKE